jgi:hypothetical protein
VSLFHSILGLRLIPGLPLHVLRGIGATALQRHDVVNHVARAWAGRRSRCRARVQFLEGMPSLRVAANPTARRPLARKRSSLSGAARPWWRPASDPARGRTSAANVGALGRAVRYGRTGVKHWPALRRLPAGQVADPEQERGHRGTRCTLQARRVPSRMSIVPSRAQPIQCALLSDQPRPQIQRSEIRC